jgi:hypothetical protein
MRDDRLLETAALLLDEARHVGALVIQLVICVWLEVVPVRVESEPV